MSQRTIGAIIGAAALIVVVWSLVGGGGGDALDVDAQPVVRRDSFRSVVTASGEVIATRYADIGTSVMGRVMELRVAEGDEVEAGYVVARIDAAQAQSAAEASAAAVDALVAEAEAADEQLSTTRSQRDVAAARQREAQREAERALRLFERGFIAESERDSAVAAAEAAVGELAAAEAGVARAEGSATAAKQRVAQARAQLAGTRDTLQKTEIVSPIDGRVTRLNVREGEMVVIGIQNQPGTTLMTISDLADIDAEVKVAEADVLRIRSGQQASVVLDALPGRSFSGRVIEIGASALPTSGAGAAAREFRVVVRLDQPEALLRPGLTCDAEIITEERRDVLTVPLQAVVLRTDDNGVEQRGVFAVDGETVRFVPVETGIIGGIEIEISGIDEGSEVVVGPFQALRALEDGARIRANRLTPAG
jgi:HlyD family secretion protein